jgi:hypothetical protein
LNSQEFSVAVEEAHPTKLPNREGVPGASKQVVHAVELPRSFSLASDGVEELPLLVVPEELIRSRVRDDDSAIAQSPNSPYRIQNRAGFALIAPELEGWTFL